MPISAYHNDPALEALAREVFALFPTCHRCGHVIERFEDADVRVHVQRVIHRAPCMQGGARPTAASAPATASERPAQPASGDPDA